MEFSTQHGIVNALSIAVFKHEVTADDFRYHMHACNQDMGILGGL